MFGNLMGKISEGAIEDIFTKKFEQIFGDEEMKQDKKKKKKQIEEKKNNTYFDDIKDKLFDRSPENQKDKKKEGQTSENEGEDNNGFFQQIKQKFQKTRSESNENNQNKINVKSNENNLYNEQNLQQKHENKNYFNGIQQKFNEKVGQLNNFIKQKSQKEQNEEEEEEKKQNQKNPRNLSNNNNINGQQINKQNYDVSSRQQKNQDNSISSNQFQRHNIFSDQQQKQEINRNLIHDFNNLDSEKTILKQVNAKPASQFKQQNQQHQQQQLQQLQQQEQKQLKPGQQQNQKLQIFQDFEEILGPQSSEQNRQNKINQNDNNPKKNKHRIFSDDNNISQENSNNSFIQIMNTANIIKKQTSNNKQISNANFNIDKNNDNSQLQALEEISIIQKQQQQESEDSDEEFIERCDFDLTKLNQIYYQQNQESEILKSEFKEIQQMTRFNVKASDIIKRIEGLYIADQQITVKIAKNAQVKSVEMFQGINQFNHICSGTEQSLNNIQQTRAMLKNVQTNYIKKAKRIYQIKLIRSRVITNLGFLRKFKQRYQQIIDQIHNFDKFRDENRLGEIIQLLKLGKKCFEQDKKYLIRFKSLQNFESFIDRKLKDLIKYVQNYFQNQCFTQINFNRHQFANFLKCQYEIEQHVKNIQPLSQAIQQNLINQTKSQIQESFKLFLQKVIMSNMKQYDFLAIKKNQKSTNFVQTVQLTEQQAENNQNNKLQQKILKQQLMNLDPLEFLESLKHILHRLSNIMSNVYQMLSKKQQQSIQQQTQLFQIAQQQSQFTGYQFVIIQNLEINKKIIWEFQQKKIKKILQKNSNLIYKLPTNKIKELLENINIWLEIGLEFCNFDPNRNEDFFNVIQRIQQGYLQQFQQNIQKELSQNLQSDTWKSLRLPGGYQENSLISYLRDLQGDSIEQQKFLIEKNNLSVNLTNQNIIKLNNFQEQQYFKLNLPNKMQQICPDLPLDETDDKSIILTADSAQKLLFSQTAQYIVKTFEKYIDLMLSLSIISVEIFVNLTKTLELFIYYVFTNFVDQNLQKVLFSENKSFINLVEQKNQNLQYFQDQLMKNLENDHEKYLFQKEFQSLRNFISKIFKQQEEQDMQNNSNNFNNINNNTNNTNNLYYFSLQEKIIASQSFFYISEYFKMVTPTIIKLIAKIDYSGIHYVQNFQQIFSQIVYQMREIILMSHVNCNIIKENLFQDFQLQNWQIKDHEFDKSIDKELYVEKSLFFFQDLNAQLLKLPSSLRQIVFQIYFKIFCKSFMNQSALVKGGFSSKGRKKLLNSFQRISSSLNYSSVETELVKSYIEIWFQGNNEVYDFLMKNKNFIPFTLISAIINQNLTFKNYFFQTNPQILQKLFLIFYEEMKSEIK